MGGSPKALAPPQDLTGSDAVRAEGILAADVGGRREPGAGLALGSRV